MNNVKRKIAANTKGGCPMDRTFRITSFIVCFLVKGATVLIMNCFLLKTMTDTAKSKLLRMSLMLNRTPQYPSNLVWLKPC